MQKMWRTKKVVALSLGLFVGIGLFPTLAEKPPAGDLDLSGPIVVKVNRDLPGKKLSESMNIVDEKGTKIPVLANPIDSKTVLISPVFDLKGVKAKFKGPGTLISWKPYEKPMAVGSQDNFKYLLKLVEENREEGLDYRYMVTMEEGAPLASAPKSLARVKEKNASADFTGTNVQVKGIDEGDTVKTDGKNIYSINGNKVYIMQAQAKEPKVLSNIGFADDSFSPLALYVEKNQLVVIGSGYGKIKSTGTYGYTKAIIYDIQDPAKPNVNRSVEIQGEYRHSRKTEGVLHVITGYNFPYHEDPIMPLYKDSLAGDQRRSLDSTKMIFPPGGLSSDITLIGSVNLQSKKEVEIQSFVGGADQFYMADNGLYFTYQKTPYWSARPMVEEVTSQEGLVTKVKDKLGINEVAPKVMPEQRQFLPMPSIFETQIIKFTVDKAKITFQNKASIQGTPINQFAMDEYKGNFRVAYEEYQLGKGTKSSAVSIFDKDMKEIGKLQSIAPGENMHSVRFMGDKAYMVTFKNVDPFFVLDMKDPRAPKMLGYLKIPGYSDYLHPLDENHIIGFGKDTVEEDGRAYYLGLKIAVFDVKDVQNPIVKNQVILGDRGSETPVLNDHKALMVDTERGVIALPVSLTKVDEKSKSKEKMPAYGQANFQGAVVFKVSAKDGIQEQGRITQIENFDPDNYDRSYDINRIIRVGESYFTLSEKQIQANDVKDLQLEGKVRIQ